MTAVAWAWAVLALSVLLIVAAYTLAYLDDTPRDRDVS